MFQMDGCCVEKASWLAASGPSSCTVNHGCGTAMRHRLIATIHEGIISAVEGDGAMRRISF